MAHLLQSRRRRLGRGQFVLRQLHHDDVAGGGRRRRQWRDDVVHRHRAGSAGRPQLQALLGHPDFGYPRSGPEPQAHLRRRLERRRLALAICRHRPSRRNRKHRDTDQFRLRARLSRPRRLCAAVQLGEPDAATAHQRLDAGARQQRRHGGDLFRHRRPVADPVFPKRRRRRRQAVAVHGSRISERLRRGQRAGGHVNQCRERRAAIAALSIVVRRLQPVGRYGRRRRLSLQLGPEQFRGRNGLHRLQPAEPARAHGGRRRLRRADRRRPGLCFFRARCRSRGSRRRHRRELDGLGVFGDADRRPGPAVCDGRRDGHWRRDGNPRRVRVSHHRQCDPGDAEI